MGHINLTINGRSYGMQCDDGQEQRVLDLGNYIDGKLKSILSSGAASNEQHLLVLTSLMLCDELFDMRDNLSALGDHVESKERADEETQLITEAIDHISERIEYLADRVKKAA